jgi:hypothetical protein
MKQDDARTLGLVLVGMYESAIYAQAAVTQPSACYTPLPMPADQLMAMIDKELATPHIETGRYQPEDHLGLILVNALRAENLCQ